MESEQRRKEIGRQLQELRKKSGYKSAAAFAKHIGIKTGTYTSYEQGEAGFSYERAWDMADALGVTLDELGGRKWPAPDYAVNPDERALVDKYRLMDEQHKGQLADLAGTLVVASEKDTVGIARDVERLGTDMRSRP